MKTLIPLEDSYLFLEQTPFQKDIWEQESKAEVTNFPFQNLQ